MGLLTNPQTRERISKVISRYNNKLCVLCYVAGLAFFISLAHRQVNAGVYFSENALLPGLVEPDFHHDFGAGGHFQSLRDEIKARKDPQNREKSVAIPSDWIVTKMRELGLDVYIQNFSFVYPEKLLKGQVFTGQNVYGILRAPRIASTEAVVLSAPYRPQESPLDKTGAGIAMMLGLAKGFRRHTYWAKDIIFLVTEHDQVGMQAWLDAYHNTENSCIYASELSGRSGSIQAALNLEIGAETFNRLNIKMEGLNGQLPNLDLINLIARLCRREQVPLSLQKRPDHTRPDTQEGVIHALRTMLEMMWNQASGVPTGNHGLFHRYHIEAVTLEGFRSKTTKRQLGFTELGRVIEGVFRSLNNLLERFHQSFFFYLLPASDRYVSIGLYMPPFGLLSAPILIKAIALWISYGIHSAEESDKAMKEQASDSTDPAKPRPQIGSIPGSSFNTVLSLMPTCVMAMFFGLGSYFSPRYFIETAAALHTTPQEGLLWGGIAVSLAAMIYPGILKRKARQKGDSGPDWQLLKCIGLLTLATVLGAISLMNISLAVFLAVVWTPVMLFVRPTKSLLLRLFEYVLLLAVSPLSLLAAACVLEHTVIHPLPDLARLALRTMQSTQDALLVSVVDTHFYGSWSYGLGTITLLPTWCIFWGLLWTDPY